MLLGLGRIRFLSADDAVDGVVREEDFDEEPFDVVLFGAEGFNGGMMEGTSTGGGVSPQRSY